MNKNTQQILAELYALDAGLKSREKELLVILDKLQKSRPTTTLDSAFVEALRADLKIEIAALPLATSPDNSGQKKLFSFSFSYMQALGLATAGVMLGVTAFNFPFSGDGYIRERRPDPTPQQIVMGSNIELVPVGADAFGKITIDVTAQEGAANAKGTGGGGAVQYMLSDAKMMPPMDATRYEYIYTGELVLPTASELPVYKRVGHNDTGSAIANMLSGYDLKLFDAKKLSNLEVQNINLVENKKMGYMISVDFINESASINPNYDTWTNPSSTCWEGDKSPEDAEKCAQQYALNLSDIPAESEMIAMADKFLSDYGIDASGYGAPYVNDEWRVYYDQTVAERAAASTDDAATMPAPWVPEQMQVVYPFVFDGQMVYDASGNPSGLSVTIDIPNKKASGIYNLTTRRYEQSDYAVENDAAAILELAKKGGVWPSWYGSDADKVEQVALGEPQQGMIQHWVYEDNISSEIFVPALIFPVEEKSTPEHFIPQVVIVPLVKDAVNIPDVYPIMYREEAVIEADIAPATEQVTPELNTK